MVLEKRSIRTVGIFTALVIAALGLITIAAIPDTTKSYFIPAVLFLAGSIVAIEVLAKKDTKKFGASEYIALSVGGIDFIYAIFSLPFVNLHCDFMEKIAGTCMILTAGFIILELFNSD